MRAGNFINAGAKGTLYKQVPKDTIGKIEIWRVVRIFGIWPVEIPFLCAGDICRVSICDAAKHPEMCDIITKANEKYNLNVTCDCNSFTPGKYQGYNYKHYVPAIPQRFLSWFASGTYRAKGQLLSPSGKQLGCGWGEGDVVF